jgi:hypothetical protein
MTSLASLPPPTAAVLLMNEIVQWLSDQRRVWVEVIIQMQPFMPSQPPVAEEFL